MNDQRVVDLNLLLMCYESAARFLLSSVSCVYLLSLPTNFFLTCFLYPGSLGSSS